MESQGGCRLMNLLVRIQHHVDLLWHEFGLPIWVPALLCSHTCGPGDGVGLQRTRGRGHGGPLGARTAATQVLQDHVQPRGGGSMVSPVFQAVAGILMWELNILEEGSWQPNLAGQEYLRLTREEWSSSQLLLPEDIEGEEKTAFTFMGFLGDYVLRLLLNGEEVLFMTRALCSFLHRWAGWRSVWRKTLSSPAPWAPQGWTVSLVLCRLVYSTIPYH